MCFSYLLHTPLCLLQSILEPSPIPRADNRYLSRDVRNERVILLAKSEWRRGAIDGFLFAVALLLLWHAPYTVLRDAFCVRCR